MFLPSLKQIQTLLPALILMLTASLPSEAKTVQGDAVLSNWSALLPHPREENKLIAAVQNSIYETSPGAEGRWEKWPVFPMQGIKIQKLFYFPQIPEFIFVLTDRGVLKTPLNASNFETVYEKRKIRETITDFAVDPENTSRFFTGTADGLLESKDAGKSWHLFTPAGKETVCFLRFSEKRFFVGRPDHLLMSDNLSRFQKVFSLPDRDETPQDESPSPAENPQEFSDETSGICRLHDLTSEENQKRWWLATQRGIFKSENPAVSWANASNGLIDPEIHFLTRDFRTERIFAAGKNDVYYYSGNKMRWVSIPVNTSGHPIRGISLSAGSLKIVTASGLLDGVILPDGIVSSPAKPLNVGGKELFQKLVRLEPTALQLQRVVSRYHHTQNSKINRWHMESRLRALLPTVSFKKDFSFGNNIDIDRRGTNDPDQFIEGPADTSRGWDFGVGWDLGDFIFSTSQTSIDSREKLMMELRHELLSEATRLFYERRRLQAEILFVPSVSEEEHFNRLFQIEELTALLDGMTDGFMGRQIELMYREHPELTELWKYSQLPEHRNTGAPEKIT